DEELELQGLEVVTGIAGARPVVEHGEQRIHLAEVCAELVARSGNVDNADRRRCGLLRMDDLRDLRQTIVGDRRHADVLFPGHARSRLRERGEECRLARLLPAHDPDFDGHQPVSGSCRWRDPSARCWRDLIAPSLLPRIVPTSAFEKSKRTLSGSACCWSSERFSISSNKLRSPMAWKAWSSAERSALLGGSGGSSSDCHRRRERKWSMAAV